MGMSQVSVQAQETTHWLHTLSGAEASSGFVRVQRSRLLLGVKQGAQAQFAGRKSIRPWSRRSEPQFVADGVERTVREQWPGGCTGILDGRQQFGQSATLPPMHFTTPGPEGEAVWP